MKHQGSACPFGLAETHLCKVRLVKEAQFANGATRMNLGLGIMDVLLSRYLKSDTANRTIELRMRYREMLKSFSVSQSM